MIRYTIRIISNGERLRPKLRRLKKLIRKYLWQLLCVVTVT
jgi:hypothetical protein